MCLRINPEVNNKDAFLSSPGLLRYGKLIRLYKQVCTSDEDNYYTSHRGCTVVFDAVTVSDRKNSDLTALELDESTVDHGLHMYLEIKWGQINDITKYVKAVVHEDDFVAFDEARNEAVFTKAIYTKFGLTEEKLKEFERMLEER